MKLVYMSMSAIPSRLANSIHVMKMCEAFAQNGHDVTLIAQEGNEVQSNGVDDFQFYGVKPSFTIIKLKAHPGKSGRNLYGLEALRTVWSIHPELIYGRFLLGCLLAARFTRAKVLFESHSPVNTNDRSEIRLFKWLLKSRRFLQMTVISAALRDYYLDTYPIGKDKMVVAHDGATLPDNVGPTKNLTHLGTNSAFHVGYIGHLYRGEGMELIAQLVILCPWASFHIIGGQTKDIAYWSDQLAHVSNIKFYGFVPPADVFRYSAACDVLLAPYQNEVYGHGKVKKHRSISQWMSPLKIFEYMALGKPMICSDLPVLREIVNPGQNGLLCPPDQAEVWATALLELKNSPELRLKLGSQAKADFEANYSWQKRAHNVLANLPAEVHR